MLTFLWSPFCITQVRAQCNCPDKDTIAIGAFTTAVTCVDAWFKHYLDRIPTARSDRKRRRHLRNAFLLKPDHPGVLEAHVAEAKQKDLRLLRDVLKCMLKNHRLLNSEVVTYNLALSRAQHRLDAFGETPLREMDLSDAQVPRILSRPLWDEVGPLKAYIPFMKR